MNSFYRVFLKQSQIQRIILCMIATMVKCLKYFFPVFLFYTPLKQETFLVTLGGYKMGIQSRNGLVFLNKFCRQSICQKFSPKNQLHAKFQSQHCKVLLSRFSFPKNQMSYRTFLYLFIKTRSVRYTFPSVMCFRQQVQK